MFFQLQFNSADICRRSSNVKSLLLFPFWDMISKSHGLELFQFKGSLTKESNNLS